MIRIASLLALIAGLGGCATGVPTSASPGAVEGHAPPGWVCTPAGCYVPPALLAEPAPEGGD